MDIQQLKNEEFKELYNENFEGFITGKMWMHAFIFKDRNPHLSLDSIMAMTLEHWNDGSESESLKPFIQDARLRFIAEFKYYFDKL